jgi:hypothetical protein
VWFHFLTYNSPIAFFLLLADGAVLNSGFLRQMFICVSYGHTWNYASTLLSLSHGSLPLASQPTSNVATLPQRCGNVACLMGWMITHFMKISTPSNLFLIQ